MVSSASAGTATRGSGAIRDIGELGLDLEHRDRGIRPFLGSLVFNSHHGRNGSTAASDHHPDRALDSLADGDGIKTRSAHHCQGDCDVDHRPDRPLRRNMNEIFLNIVALPNLWNAQSPRSLHWRRVADGHGAKLTHIKAGARSDPSGVLETAKSLGRRAQQLLSVPTIVRQLFGGTAAFSRCA